MATILKRLIPENDSHTILHEFKPNKVQVIPEYLMNFKVLCRGRASPLKVTIHYPEFKPDLTCYTSLEHTVPNSKNCKDAFVVPRVFHVSAENKRKDFAVTQLYISFYSSSQLSLEVSVKFHEQKHVTKLQPVIKFEDYYHRPEDDPFYALH